MSSARRCWSRAWCANQLLGPCSLLFVQYPVLLTRAINDCHGPTQLNIGTNSTDAFPTAANAAFNMTLNPPFSPYANNLFFIHGAFIFEDVGVTAYQVRRRPAAGLLPDWHAVFTQQGYGSCQLADLADVWPARLSAELLTSRLHGLCRAFVHLPRALT